MKKLILIFFSLMVFTACSEERMSPQESYSLIKVSGGFAGVDENYQPGDIIWTLNDQNGTLTVEKNISESFTGINEGVYSYYIEIIDDKLYFNIDSLQTGGLSLFQNKMIIDENLSSEGSRADGFIYRFEK